MIIKNTNWCELVRAPLRDKKMENEKSMFQGFVKEELKEAREKQHSAS